MDEAAYRLQQSPATNHAQARAIIVPARQRAIKETKQQLRSRGLKPQHFAHREIAVEMSVASFPCRSAP
jgi:hypothetical protein